MLFFTEKRKEKHISVSKYPAGGGGGGGTSIFYAYWVWAAREIPIFSPEFPFRSISFSQITNNPFRSITILHFFVGFCRSGDHHFQNFFTFNPFIASHGRLSPNAKRSAAPRLAAVPEIRIFTLKNGSSSFGDSHFHAQKRIKLVPEPRIFTLKTAQARSGAPHFHARPGARSGALAHCSLCPRHIPTKIWGEYPSPPPPPPGLNV